MCLQRHLTKCGSVLSRFFELSTDLDVGFTRLEGFLMAGLDAQEYTILRLIPGQAPTDAQIRFGTKAVESPVEVESTTEVMTSAQAADEAQAPNTFALAPTLPLSLVEPFAKNEVELPDDGGSSWGVEAVGALSSSSSGAGVKVAVLDTGIDLNHNAFSQLTVSQRDFTGEGDGDADGHGTHCAATIAGCEVDGFRCGVAPGIDELLVGKVIGVNGGSTTALQDAILWALMSGAHVISMSLGVDFPEMVEQWVVRGLQRRAATSRALAAYRANVALFDQLAGLLGTSAATGRGALAIAATGNESERSTKKSYTIDVAPPAAAEGFVAVGALEKDGEGIWKVADFSNTGGAVAAPGVDIISARLGGGYVRMSGTSMATPHVAGVAALWAERELERSPSGSLDVTRLFGRVVGHADELDGLPTTDVGAGLARAPQS